MRQFGQAQSDQMRLRSMIEGAVASVIDSVNTLDASLAPVAKSGEYTDLTGTPDLSIYAESADLAAVATSGAYSDLSGTPTLATVATSGAYADLTGKPTIPVVPTVVSAFTNDAGYLTQHQSLAGYATESWVTSQGYLTQHQSLAGYATESWVTSQGYLTQHQDISGKQDALATEAVAITLPEVTELTTHNIVCYRYGNVVQVKISVTLSAALSSATTVATGLPAPAVELYDIVNTWTSSYRRPIRARITTTGDLTFQYGYATSYNHVLTYLAA